MRPGVFDEVWPLATDTLPAGLPSGLMVNERETTRAGRRPPVEVFAFEDGWEQREYAGSLCQKFCCELPHRGTHRSHRHQSAVTCSADREPPE